MLALQELLRRELWSRYGETEGEETYQVGVQRL